MSMSKLEPLAMPLNTGAFQVRHHHGGQRSLSPATAGSRVQSTHINTLHRYHTVHQASALSGSCNKHTSAIMKPGCHPVTARASSRAQRMCVVAQSQTPRQSLPPAPIPATPRKVNSSFNNAVPFPFLQLTNPTQQIPTVHGAFKASGKTVVITGGSQGIGRATALYFARKGFNVVVAARDAQKLQYVANDCAAVAGRQGAALGVVCDVTDERQVKDLVNTVLSRFEDVDVLVNNAGIITRGPFLDVPWKEAERIMKTNYLGAYMVTQAFVPLLAKEAQRKNGNDRPSIIMVNSFAGKVPMKSMSAFTASKHALMGFTESIRAELEPMHVHVGQVHPGVVKSNHMERTTFYGKDEETERKAFRQAVRALPITQSCHEVAESIYYAAMNKHNDVVVGAPFVAVDMAHRVTGFNPLAMPLAFL